MTSPRLAAAALLGLSLYATAPRADESLTTEAAAAQLSAVLSLVSGGTLGTPASPPEVARDKDAFKVRVPLPTLAEPPGAALTAEARPLGGGAWDIMSASLPAMGAFTVVGSPASGGTSRIAFAIGQQTITARIDPSLSQPSPFSIDLRDVSVLGLNDGRQTEQKIGRQTFQGTLTGEPDHRLTLRAQGTASNWRIAAQDDTGTPRESLIRSAASSIELEGLDRAQADRLRGAMQRFADAVQTPGGAGGKQRSLTDQQRVMLSAAVDALQGLLNRINIEETAEGIHFEGPGDAEGDIGRVRMGLSGESRDDRLTANIDLALHDLTLSSVPPDLAIYLPTLLQVRPALSGVRTSAVMALLRHAAAGANADALTAEAMALMAEPGARLGFENLSLKAGPLRLEGSGRMLPAHGGGAPGLEAHVTAHGVDATLAAMQGNPMAQQILPLVFLVKGMGRAQGDALVWDVALTDGVLRVNGVPFGQSESASKPQPSQKKRQRQ